MLPLSRLFAAFSTSGPETLSMKVTFGRRFFKASATGFRERDSSLPSGRPR